jgi:hypothetical protein
MSQSRKPRTPVQRLAAGEPGHSFDSYGPLTPTTHRRPPAYDARTLSWCLVIIAAVIIYAGQL